MANTVDASGSNLDQSVRIFDSFYNIDLVIPADRYEIVRSYFVKVTSSYNVAENFTQLLFRIAQLTGTDVMVLLGNLQGTTKVQMNGLLAYYLNSIKSKTTLYGIGSSPQPNPSIQRNVVL